MIEVGVRHTIAVGLGYMETGRPICAEMVDEIIDKELSSVKG